MEFFNSTQKLVNLFFICHGLFSFPYFNVSKYFFRKMIFSGDFKYKKRLLCNLNYLQVMMRSLM